MNGYELSRLQLESRLECRGENVDDVLMRGNKMFFALVIFFRDGKGEDKKKRATISAPECFEINVGLFVPFNAIIILLSETQRTRKKKNTENRSFLESRVVLSRN